MKFLIFYLLLITLVVYPSTYANRGGGKGGGGSSRSGGSKGNGHTNDNNHSNGNKHSNTPAAQNTHANANAHGSKGGQSPSNSGHATKTPRNDVSDNNKNDKKSGGIKPGMAIGGMLAAGAIGASLGRSHHHNKNGDMKFLFKFIFKKLF